MGNTIQLSEVYVANGLGLVLTLMLIAANWWRLRIRNLENRALLCMFLSIIMASLMDALVFTVDGKPGTFLYILNYAGNWLLYLANIIVGPCWLLLICTHLHIRLSRRHMLILAAANLSGLVLLLINFFSPICFGIDNANVYYRGPCFFVFLMLEFLTVLDGIGVYIFARRKGGVLKFFPVFAFVIPAIIGIILQSVFYGISAIWPFVSISMGSMMANLQNESIFQDSLTGLFNRAYLDDLKKHINRESSGKLTALMLDVNGFKTINDQYGHLMGDEALIETARLLSAAVDRLGSVIRYAGDEFVILLNTQDDQQISECVAAIRRNMENFNQTANKPYHLSVAIGCCKLNLKKQNVDQLLNEVDQRMFEDKRAYYAEHRELDRRKR